MGKLPRGKRALNAALDAATSPVYLLDSDRRLVYANAPFWDWLRIAAEEGIGRTCHSEARPRVDAGHFAGLAPPAPANGAPYVWQGLVWHAADQQIHLRRATGQGLEIVGERGTLWTMVVLSAVDEPADRGVVTQPTCDADELRQQMLAFPAVEFVAPGVDVLVGFSAQARRLREWVELAGQCSIGTTVCGAEGTGLERLARSIADRRSGGGITTLVPLAAELADGDAIDQAFRAAVRIAELAGDERMATLMLLDADRLPAELHGGFATLFERYASRVAVLATAAIRLDVTPGFDLRLAKMLSGLVIEVPPLRERLDDLPLLIQAVIEDLNRANPCSVVGVRPDAFELLLNHAWRRETDELYEVIQQAHAASSDGWIGVENLPKAIRLSADAELNRRREPEGIDMDAYLRRMEAELIDRALVSAKGNRAQAARLLGISRTRLLRYLGQPSDED